VEGPATTFLRVLVAALLLSTMAGCAGRARPVPVAGIELPQEAVPPGVRPMTREVEEIGGATPGDQQ